MAKLETSRHQFCKVIFFLPSEHADEIKNCSKRKLAVKLEGITMSPGLSENDEAKVDRFSTTITFQLDFSPTEKLATSTMPTLTITDIKENNHSHVSTLLLLPFLSNCVNTITPKAVSSIQYLSYGQN